MKIKNIEINSYDEIDSKTWLSLNKSCNSYNGIKFYLVHDKGNPKIKNVIYTFNEDDKVVKENRGKSMKQSEFQETVLTAISKMNIEFEDFKTFVIEQFAEQKKFNEQQLKFNEQQMEFNKSFSNRLDSIENRLTSVETRLDSVDKRLTRLESFHKNDMR